MKGLAILLLVLATTASAQASAVKTLRVDRPEKGAGARVTTVRVLRGSVHARTRAVVLTDSRCDADRHGISHCLNTLKLASGKVVLVQHDHRMATMPCLSPGEHVTLTPR